MNSRFGVWIACMAGTLALVATASAQSFNIDFGTATHVVPSSSYGGAANQTGLWNLITDASVPAFSGALVDVSGQPTGVTILPRPTSGLQSFSYGPLGFSAEEEALILDAAWNTDASPFSTITFTITGLEPGAYEVFVYVGHVNDCLCASSVQSTAPAQPICYSPGLGFTEGNVWSRLCATASSGTIAVRLSNCNQPLTYVECSGMQIVRRPFSCAEVAEPFCSGVAVGASCACPCGNCGLAGRGCENSFATGGGRLATSGTSSVSADTLVLQADSLPPTSSALFFQGTATTGGGFGSHYGDGLRCVGGSATRLGTRFASGGAVAFGAGQGSDPLVSAAGAVPAGGGTRYYQVWYRNAPLYCTPATFNLTNGYKVLWTP